MKVFIIGLFLISIVSCETKDYDEYPTSAYVEGETSAVFSSSKSFNGLSGVTSVTDTSALLYWTDSDDAQEYYIYDVTDGIIQLIDRVEAPASYYSATKLKSGQSYSFLVRMKDDDSLIDSNEKSVTITTNSQPDTPTITLNYNDDNFTYAYDIRKNPYIQVTNLRPSDTVKIYTDSACSDANLVGSATTENTVADVKVDELTSFGSYEFYAKTTNVNGVDSDCTTTALDYEFLECPDGYIKVPADSGNEYVANDFCVMQFEAKPWYDIPSYGLANSSDVYGLNSYGCNEYSCSTENWGTSFFKPGSYEGSSGSVHRPWRRLDMQTAKDECRSLGEGYDLINIYEWMTIARNVEAVPSNWDSGIVGSGCMFRGNVGIDDSCGYKLTDSSGLRDVDGRAEADRTGTALTAKLTLSNGQNIWDFAGNLSEWVDFGSEDQDDVQIGPEDCNDSWSEYGSQEMCDIEPDGDSDLDEIYYSPGNPASVATANYNSDYGLGQFEGGTGGATLRGGSYKTGIYAGAFAISFSAYDDMTFKDVGFRCVYRPYQD